MDKIKVTFTAKTTSPDLKLIVKLNNEKVWESSLTNEFVEQEFFFREIDGKYTLSFCMDGKNNSHTKIDSSGNIVEDHYIEIQNLNIDDVDVGQIWFDNTVYHHDFNGSGKKTEDKFFGTLGCNGEAVFSFECPFYIWYLETLSNP